MKFMYVYMFVCMYDRMNVCMCVGIYVSSNRPAIVHPGLWNCSLDVRHYREEGSRKGSRNVGIEM